MTSGRRSGFDSLVRRVVVAGAIGSIALAVALPSSGCGARTDLEPPSRGDSGAGVGAGTASSGATGATGSGATGAGGGTGATGAGGSSSSTSAAGGFGGGEPCRPMPETCNGIDDDCDGIVDDGTSGNDEPCDTGLLGPCSMGVTLCEAGALTCIAAIEPVPEVCDAIDNDCNGAADDGVSCSRRVFVTSLVYSGDLGGLAGADAKCQARADTAGLAGTYKAWLSDLTADAATRLTHVGVPYVLADGVTVVAANWAQLTSGGLQHAIDKTEILGAAPIGTAQCDVPNLPMVWTNTQESGAMFQASETCNSWSGGLGPSAWGSANHTGSSWTLHCNGGGVPALNCQNTAALYCFEQ